MPWLIVVIALSLISNGVQAWLLISASGKCDLQIASLENDAAKSLAAAVEAETNKSRIDNQIIADRLIAVTKQLHASKNSYRSAVNAKPLPMDCRADADRVRAVNASRAKE